MSKRPASKKRHVPTKFEKAIKRAYRKGFKDGRAAEAMGSYRDD